MIDEVDAALRAYLHVALPADTSSQLSFDAPTREWSAAVKAPTLNLFLCDVRENLQARAGEWADVRDESRQLVGRQPPVRRFDLAYLVSAWGAEVEDEHALLGAVLAALPVYDSLPAEHLGGRLADQGLSVGLRLGESTSAWDLWSSLGQPPRSSVTLVATTPFRPALMTELAPPAASLDIGLAGSNGRPGRSPVPHIDQPAGSTTPRTAAGRPPANGDRGPDGKPAGWTAYRLREQPPPVPAAGGAEGTGEEP